MIFRTSAYGVIATSDWDVPMAFEVDHVDYSDQRGWSVVAVGRASGSRTPRYWRRSSGPGTRDRGLLDTGRCTSGWRGAT